MYIILFFFFKQKTAYEMRISDWSSDVCSSDLARRKSPVHAIGRIAPLPCNGGAWPLRSRPPATSNRRQRRGSLIEPPSCRYAHRAANGLFQAPCPVRRMLRHERNACREIGRASGRESVCQSVSIPVVAAALNKK